MKPTERPVPHALMLLESRRIVHAWPCRPSEASVHRAAGPYLRRDDVWAVVPWSECLIEDFAVYRPGGGEQIARASVGILLLALSLVFGHYLLTALLTFVVAMQIPDGVSAWENLRLARRGAPVETRLPESNDALPVLLFRVVGRP